MKTRSRERRAASGHWQTTTAVIYRVGTETTCTSADPLLLGCKCGCEERGEECADDRK